MNDTITNIIAIGLAVALLIVMPVMTMADRVDTVVQTHAETITSEYVNELRTTGKITNKNYSQFVEKLSSNGNTYDVEIEVKRIDENPGKKALQATTDKIGENNYYSMYTSQIMPDVENPDIGYFELEQGDLVSVKVRNTNVTLGKHLKNFFYKMGGRDDAYSISAVQSGLVTTSGEATTE